MKLFDMNLREGIGLVMLVLGIALVPMGWLEGGGVLSVAVVLLSIGIWLFYTRKMQARDAASSQHETDETAATRDLTGRRGGDRRAHDDDDAAGDN